jgi:hypothetical protein
MMGKPNGFLDLRHWVRFVAAPSAVWGSGLHRPSQRRIVQTIWSMSRLSGVPFELIYLYVIQLYL